MLSSLGHHRLFVHLYEFARVLRVVAMVLWVFTKCIELCFLVF